MTVKIPKKPYNEVPRGRKWEKTRAQIVIKPETKAELEQLGKMKDTYDDVIRKLIDCYKEHNK